MELDKNSEKLSLYSNKVTKKTLLPTNKIMASLQQESVKNKNYKLPLHNKFENQIVVIVKFDLVGFDVV